jgi:hypothetical protein
MLSGTRRAFFRGSILSPWTRSTSFAPASITPTRAFATGFIEEEKAVHVHNLLKAKKEARLTFDEIAVKTGLTNAYVAQVEKQEGLDDLGGKPQRTYLGYAPSMPERTHRIHFS